MYKLRFPSLYTNIIAVSLQQYWAGIILELQDISFRDTPKFIF